MSQSQLFLTANELGVLFHCDSQLIFTIGTVSELGLLRH